MKIFQRSTHSGQLERWLGKDQVEQVSKSMKGWYGPSIAVAGVPGKVYATKDGDFQGKILTGMEASAYDIGESLIRRVKRGFRHASKNANNQVNAGFASLSDLIAEGTAGKRTFYNFLKSGTTGVVAASNSLWRVGAMPAAGAAASAAPGGIAPTDATTGAYPFTNPTGGDTQHFTVGYPTASVAGNTLLLYDRIFAVAKTMNSTGTESVTGVPSRYQGTTGGAANSAEGNFLFIETGTALAATAHNWTVCIYTDQSGNGTITLPTVTGNSANIINRLDQPTSTWFCPLATDDTGIQQLDQMQCSAAVATGAIDFVIGHPIAWMPCPIANLCCVADGINTSFNLVRIYDDAALAFLEITKPATTATTYTGSFESVAG